MTVIERAIAEGVLRPEHRGLSAKELRQRDPAAADRWARFIRDHKAELVALVAGRLD